MKLRVLLFITTAALMSFAANAAPAPVPNDGTLVMPSDGLTHPAVLVMAPEAADEAALLVARGFVVLTLPKVEADLSKTYEAYRWLRASSFVQGKPTAIYGVSEGAEPALALAVYLARRAGRSSPNAVAVHAASFKLTVDWNWEGSVPGLMQGQEIRIERYSGSLLMTQGAEDSLSGAREFESVLRGAGAAVRTAFYPGGAVGTPQPVRAEFDYFAGQGARFTPESEALRRELVGDFFTRTLSGR